jgi:hypothetical protein
MEMSDPAMSAYSNARLEYTAQLNQFLVPALMKFTLEMLEKAREETATEPKRLLWQFQMYLNDIPDWNMDRVQREVHAIQLGTGCEYLEDLITAIFIAHTKILTAIQVSSKKRNLNISVPKVEYFLFKVLCETSKLLWKSAYLFRDNVSNIEKQQNYQQVERIIEQGIVHAIRCMVPVKTILRDCMAVGGGEDDVEVEVAKEEESDDEEEIPAVVEAVPEVEIPAPAPEEHVVASVADEPLTVPDTTVSEAAAAAPLTVQEHEAEVEQHPVMAAISAATEAIASVIAPAPAPAPAPETPAVLSFNTSKRVGFTDLNSHFDSDNPEESDIIYEPHSDYEDGYGTLEIKEEAPITADDFDTLDDGGISGSISADDYEVM